MEQSEGYDGGVRGAGGATYAPRIARKSIPHCVLVYSHVYRYEHTCIIDVSQVFIVSAEISHLTIIWK